jgi:alkanesulfonate monooxygenase SsuD/methylene tetrahydromethanopterin reductase-like flavin-dependent oxidoreductase (luciferase family)
MSAMDIDRLSDGRFVLGLGPSAREMVEGERALTEMVKAAGRERAAFHWQAGFFVAVTDDAKQAIDDAKATVALYAGVEQCEPFFAAHGFRAEADTFYG